MLARRASGRVRGNNQAMELALRFLKKLEGQGSSHAAPRAEYENGDDHMELKLRFETAQ